MPELIRIDAACKLLERSPRTLRLWTKLGHAPNGTRIRVMARDEFTKYVYFDRRAIERVAADRLIRI